VGKLYAFDITNFNKSKTPQIEFTITGIDPSGKLGMAFTVGNPVDQRLFLALAIPTKLIKAEHIWDEDKAQAGEVLLLDIATLKGHLTVDKLQPYVHFQSNEVSFNEISQVCRNFLVWDGKSIL
jgi:hypothetical protein